MNAELYAWWWCRPIESLYLITWRDETMLSGSYCMPRQATFLKLVLYVRTHRYFSPAFLWENDYCEYMAQKPSFHWRNPSWEISFLCSHTACVLLHIEFKKSGYCGRRTVTQLLNCTWTHRMSILQRAARRTFLMIIWSVFDAFLSYFSTTLRLVSNSMSFDTHVWKSILTGRMNAWKYELVVSLTCSSWKTTLLKKNCRVSLA